MYFKIKIIIQQMSFRDNPEFSKIIECLSKIRLNDQKYNLLQKLDINNFFPSKIYIISAFSSIYLRNISFKFR
jgi:hypothetical protein